jgi:hypothetical protein
VTDSTDIELRALRERAYRRDSDIHLDPQSLQRLRELESAAHQSENPAGQRTAEPAPVGQTILEPEPEPEIPEPREPRWRVWLLAAGQKALATIRWVRGLRRSTVLIALSVLAVAASLITILTVVQRVQVDPLYDGATQIARLSPDQGYDIPPFLESFGGELDAYTDFHGMRAFIGIGGPGWNSDPDAVCLILLSPANQNENDPNSWSGPLFSGCAAGDFPPLLQIRVDDQQQFPEDFVAAFPEGTGLQLIYDDATDEIVVYSDQK